jgi:hypothetical protein
MRWLGPRAIGGIMNAHLKRKLAFALSMGMVTTGIISFALIVLNVGLSRDFLMAWLLSWAVGYVMVIPAILMIGPRLQAVIDRMIPENPATQSVKESAP